MYYVQSKGVLCSMKVKFFDKQIAKWFYGLLSGVSVVTSIVFLFVEIEEKYKAIVGLIAVFIFLAAYVAFWLYANNRNSISLKVNGVTVEVKFGDIFNEESDWKAISFNEYFDTIVDDKIIARNSLNGMYINKFFYGKVDQLDQIIQSDPHLATQIVSTDAQRPNGKKTKYQLWSVCVVGRYLLTALTHFDSQNKAYIEMGEYISFLLSFWEEVDRIYAGKTVSIPVFGSGITRFKDYNEISDQELLQLIIWSFKVSEIRLAYSAKVKIIVYTKNRNKVNLQALTLI